MTHLDALIENLVAAVTEIPGVGDAAVVVRRNVRAETADGLSADSTTDSGAPDAAGKAGAGGADVAVDASEASIAAATGVAVAATGGARPAAELDGGELRVPDGAPTTPQDALRAAAELSPDKWTIFITPGNPDAFQSYAELLAEAQRVLAGLRAAGLRPGDAALFVFEDNRRYLTAFWACVLGGFIPTPVAVAPTYGAPNEVNRKLHNAWLLLDRPVLLTDGATAGQLTAVRALWQEPGVHVLTVEELLDHPPDTGWFAATPDSPVLNLLTSGSTGVPKCVQHTNSSVAARSYAAARHCGITSDDVTLTVMPFDHVTVPMYNVRDVFLRCQHVNARTSHFLGDCLLLLDWVDRHRVTNLWVPNFAFTMINERAAEIAERSWDLSCLRELTNGAEPVIAGTSQRFLELLAPHGLPAGAMAPCWGMSETCSGITYSRQSRHDRAAGTVAIDPATLSRTIRHVDPGDRDAVVLSRVGRPIPGVRLRVVDEAGRVLPEDELGELRVRGRTMMRGYFGNAAAQAEAYDEDGWFRTGDLAFVHDGEVVIAGRIKDQIIVRGINYLAHELEIVVERVDGVRVTFSAAAGVREPGADTDSLVVFFVPERWDAASVAAIAARVRAALGREAGLSPDLLVPVTEAEFAKTSSGKKQRAAMVNELRAGTFGDRAIGRDAGDGAADTWLGRWQWVELPSAHSGEMGHSGAMAHSAGLSRGGSRTTRAGDGAGVSLVLAADGDLRHLGIASAVPVAGRGARLHEERPDRFRVATTDRAQLRRLLEIVTGRHGALSTVVVALPLSTSGEPLERIMTATAELTALLAALDGGQFGTPRALVLTAGSVYVRHGDRVDLGACALTGLVRTVAGEATSFTIHQLDLPGDRDEWAQAVRAELAESPRATGIVAAREGRRWQPKLVPVDEEDPMITGKWSSAEAAQRPFARNQLETAVVGGGLYLITGGLGGIAREVAGYLAVEHGVRLLLVGRSPAGGARADQLAELAGIGDVAYQQLDVADADALEAAVNAAETRWGRRLDGVLHLAGADPTGQWADLDSHLVVNESMATFAEQYRSKIAGTLAVAAVLEARPRASLVLFGSVNGEFGGRGFGAYASANGFLAGFADHWYRERGRAVRCVAWSMWTVIGMNRAQPTAASARRGFRPIEPATGLRLFLSALALPHHHLLAGLDLANPEIVDEVVAERVAVSELLVAYTVEDAEPETVAATVAARVSGCPVPVRLVELPRIPRGAGGEVDGAWILHTAVTDRPRRTFAAPATELERRIARIWSSALDHPRIGRDDSFFELGGNSLRAARLLALVDHELGIRITTQELYEKPTVAAMAAAAQAAGN